jgi:hypothetical protein
MMCLAFEYRQAINDATQNRLLGELTEVKV